MCEDAQVNIRKAGDQFLVPDRQCAGALLELSPSTTMCANFADHHDSWITPCPIALRGSARGSSLPARLRPKPASSDSNLIEDCSLTAEEKFGAVSLKRTTWNGAVFAESARMDGEESAPVFRRLTLLIDHLIGGSSIHAVLS